MQFLQGEASTPLSSAVHLQLANLGDKVRDHVGSMMESGDDNYRGSWIAGMPMDHMEVRALSALHLVRKDGGPKANGKSRNMDILRPGGHKMTSFMNCNDGCQHAEGLQVIESA